MHTNVCRETTVAIVICRQENGYKGTATTNTRASSTTATTTTTATIDLITPITYSAFIYFSGLFKILGELVEYVDPQGEYDLKDRFNLAIYSKNSPVCRPGKYHF